MLASFLFLITSLTLIKSDIITETGVVLFVYRLFLYNPLYRTSLENIITRRSYYCKEEVKVQYVYSIFLQLYKELNSLIENIIQMTYILT